MSPAPQRVHKADPYRSFPHSWGYGLGLLLMVVGIGVAIFMVVGGIRGFTDDVRGLRRDAGNLQLGLEEGEYLVFDEDGLDLGPFSAKVTRTSDGREIPTRSVDDGTTYDVDGRSGRAKLSFNVPTSDIYRVELDTSVGEVARFAVGSDVGNDRANAITRGILFGSVLLILGFVAIVVTLIQHARWRLRGEVDRGASRARDAVAQVADLVDGSTPAPPPSERAASWGRDRIDQARDAVAAAAEESASVSAVGDALAGQATDALDQLEGELDAAQHVAAEVTGVAPTPTDLAARIDEALGRVQERVASGDRLRDIARDETALAGQTAAELTGQAKAAGQLAVDRVATLGEADPDVEEPQQVGLPAPPPPSRPVEDATATTDPEPTELGLEVGLEDVTPREPQDRPPVAPPPSHAFAPPSRGSVGTKRPFAALTPPPTARPVGGARLVVDREPEVPAVDVDIEPEEAQDSRPPSKPDRAGFSLAPPPDYSAVRGR